MSQIPSQHPQQQSANESPSTDQFGSHPSGQPQQADQQQGLPTYRTQNFLSEPVRQASIAALNQVLADAVVLRSQVQSAHWNVKGPDFYQLHELFEDIAETLADHIDEIAERVTALGGTARGTVRVAAGSSSLPQYPLDVVDGQAVLQQLAHHLATLDSLLYQHLQSVSEQGDLDTADLLNEVSRDVSKALWFVEAHLQGPGGRATTGGQLSAGRQ